jgi:hypothetical protein
MNTGVGSITRSLVAASKMKCGLNRRCAIVDGMLPPAEKLPKQRISERLLRVWIWILLLLLLIGGITFTLETFHKVFYPFGWDDDEGAVWWEAAHVTDLRMLYHPIRQYPYFVVPYPPVYHALTWLAAKGTKDYLIAGRLVCVFSALGIGLLVGLVVLCALPRKMPIRIRGSSALIAALLCFRLDSLNTYIPEMGVDLLALCFTFLGVFLFLRSSQIQKLTYLAFACFVAAIFTKQTMVAAPSACLVATLLISPARSMRYLLYCVVLATAGMGYLAWATGGEVLRHLFFYNAVQPFSLTHWIVGMQSDLVSMTPIAAVACLSLFPLVGHVLRKGQRGYIQWLRAKLQTSPYRLTLLVLGMELVIAVATSFTYGKIGSGVHYFLEWNFVCCPLAGLLVARVLDQGRTPSTYTLGGVAVLLLLFFAALTGFPDSLRRVNSTYRLSASERYLQDAEYAANSAALKIIEQTHGPALSENMVLLMKAHKEIPIEPGIQNFLGKAGIWDESGFVGMITSQQFGVIVMRNLDSGFWTDGVVRAVKSSYVPTEQIGDERVEDCHYTVYKPLRGDK